MFVVTSYDHLFHVFILYNTLTSGHSLIYVFIYAVFDSADLSAPLKLVLDMLFFLLLSFVSFDSFVKYYNQLFKNANIF